MMPSPHGTAGDAVRIAVEDPSLRARVIERAPLTYSVGADESLDRPAHVRSGSSLALLGDRVAIIQDDANFIALLAPFEGKVDAVMLPAGEAGRRQFDDVRGNKRFKLDLEASVAAVEGGRVTLFAFGSGSSPSREYVAIVSGLDGGDGTVEMLHARALYAALRATPAFAGSELNIEGAALMAEEIWWFGRGNGAPRDGRRPINATCVLPWPALRDHLRSGGIAPLPTPTRVTRYELGTIGAIPLGFTDALAVGGSLLYSAAAEASPDALSDGPVSGSALGIIGPGGVVRWSPLTDTRGRLFAGKVEGIAWQGDSRDRLRAVLDHDNPGTPAELCVVALDGPWLDHDPVR